MASSSSASRNPTCFNVKPCSSRISINPLDEKENVCPQLECHMSWIKEMIPFLPSPERKDEIFQIAVERASKKLKESLDDLGIISPWEVVDSRLFLAALHAHLSNYSEALDLLADASECMKEITFQRDEHQKVYYYLIAANCRMLVKMFHLEIKGSVVMEDSVSMNMSLFDVKSNVFQAAFAMSKGFLEYKMRFECSQLEYFRKGIELDPETVHFYVVLYRALRNHRRNRCHWSSPPNKEEVDIITKAYELDSNSWEVLCNYANMLDEQTKGRRDLSGEAKAKIGSKIIDLMVLAIQKNSEDKFTRVRLAEIYGYGKYPHLDSKHGEALFLACLKKWPKSSRVYHKFGRYYAIMGNWTKALEFYTLGTDLKGANFPCLMDCLKLMGRQKPDYNQMLSMIDRSLPAFRFDKQRLTKLLNAKGLLLWLLDSDGTKKRKACDVWLDSAINYSTGSGCREIVKIINQGFMDIVGKFSVDCKELIEVLSQALPQPGANDDEDYVTIRALKLKDFIHELESHGSWKHAKFKFQNQLFHTHSSRPSSTSLADRDDNWRRGPAPEIRGITPSCSGVLTSHFYHGIQESPIKQTEAKDKDWR